MVHVRFSGLRVSTLDVDTEYTDLTFGESITGDGAKDMIKTAFDLGYHRVT
jgi:hypothetical protein